MGIPTRILSKCSRQVEIERPLISIQFTIPKKHKTCLFSVGFRRISFFIQIQNFVCDIVSWLLGSGSD